MSEEEEEKKGKISWSKEVRQGGYSLFSTSFRCISHFHSKQWIPKKAAPRSGALWSWNASSWVNHWVINKGNQLDCLFLNLLFSDSSGNGISQLSQPSLCSLPAATCLAELWSSTSITFLCSDAQKRLHHHSQKYMGYFSPVLGHY